jgi:hypothetical protein
MLKQHDTEAAVAVIIRAATEKKRLRDARERLATDEWLRVSSLFLAKHQDALSQWAMDQWESDKDRGVGKGMTEDEAKAYYIRSLAHGAIRACQVLGIDFSVLGLASADPL